MISHAAVEQLRQRTSQQIASNAERLADEEDGYDETDFVDDSHGVLLGGLLAAFAHGSQGSADGTSWAQDAADKQRPYLEGFAGDIASSDSPLSEAEIAARADLYAGGVWTGYVRGGVEEQSLANPDQGYVWESEQDDATCSDCAGLDGTEYASIDEIDAWPGDGSQECLGNCRCRITTAEVGAAV